MESSVVERVHAPMDVLVQAATAGAFHELVAIGDAIVGKYGGNATALSVVEVPPERSLSEGARAAQRRRRLMAQIARAHPDSRLRAEVRTAHAVEEGIRGAVRELAVDLLLLSWQPGRSIEARGALEGLYLDPPCDLAVVKRGKSDTIRSVLLPVRGGPHARLALRIAEAVAAHFGAVLTLLHIDLRHWDARHRAREERFFDAIRSRVSYAQTRIDRVCGTSAEEELMRAGAGHDLVVMGAAARDQTSPYLFGQLPMRVARGLEASVVIVETREPVTGQTFGLPDPAEVSEVSDLSQVVDRWFAENTFHSREFRQVNDLVDLKERQGVTISLAIPTLNEEKTVGKILSTVQRQLVQRYPLIDELVVIDSMSTDGTVEIAESMGVPVFRHPEILPETGSFVGKGEALWKSLYVTRGDIVAWVDSDITGFHPKFVYGLIGPLLSQPRVQFVKGFYRRPLNMGSHITATGGGRVTELTARPMINLFYPELSGIVQPLAGEMAGRREVLQSIPFFTGYGVETGLLIDILYRYGLKAIAQTDLQERVHRNQTLLSLSKMAFAIVQVVLRRLDQTDRLRLLEEVSTSMKLIHYSPNELFLEIQEIREQERPAIESIAEYRARFPERV